MGSYSIGDLSRREILKMSVVLAGSSVAFSTNLTAAEVALRRTPAQILGPFYPLNKLTRNSDLTRVPGRTGHADGQVLNVMGRVLNLAGGPFATQRSKFGKPMLTGATHIRTTPIRHRSTRTSWALPCWPPTRKAAIDSKQSSRQPILLDLT